MVFVHSTPAWQASPPYHAVAHPPKAISDKIPLIQCVERVMVYILKHKTALKHITLTSIIHSQVCFPLRQFHGHFVGAEMCISISAFSQVDSYAQFDIIRILMAPWSIYFRLIIHFVTLFELVQEI